MLEWSSLVPGPEAKSPSSESGNPTLFTKSYQFCPIVRITQDVAFSDRLLALGNVNLGSLQVFPWLDCSLLFHFSSVQSLSRVQLFATPWTAGCQASLSITNSQSLFKLMSIQSVMPSSHLILCHPLLLLPSIFPSIRVISNESALRMSWPKYWSFSFSISPSNEYSGLTSFRMEWLDLLAVQGALKSLLQHHSSKSSILWCSAFFIIQLSHSFFF